MNAAAATASAIHPLTLRYAAGSEVVSAPAQTEVRLALDETRGPVGLRGRVRAPALFRDALLTAAAVLQSDLRHKTRDRSAYLAYLTKQGKKATAATWEAHKAFLEQSFADDTRKRTVLDPALTVHPDELSLEVFSRDESSYARLSLSNEVFDAAQRTPGTTFADISDEWIEGLSRLRAYAPVEFDALATPTPGGGAAKKTPETRALEVPYAWIRGFLQVQSAATLPAATATLAPIDLYNLLFVLRTRKAKKAPRALRFELVPGARPRMVIEPWEIVLECHGPVYAGPAPRVVRTFGRQRLLALSRLLPHLRSARVQLVGAGLPVFWALDLGVATFTLALTGWTESGWSSAASFDALTPPANAAPLAERVRAVLHARGPLALPDIAQATQSAAPDARAALQLECLRGRVVYDLARGVYRPRDLLAQPVDEAKIKFGSEREARAHRLLAEGGGAGKAAVKLKKVHEIAGEGTEVQGEVTDHEARRSFSPRFLLDLEGRTREASCGCSQFRRAGMREGPCEHMIALRLFYARKRAEAEAQRNTPEGRKLIRAETRTYVRREADGSETVYRLSLDGRSVQVRWGKRVGEARQQRMAFDTEREALMAYFGRLESLSAEGFVDADTSAA